MTVICAACCFFKQKTAYEMRISDWSSDVCASDLPPPVEELGKAPSSRETLSRAWSASMQSPVKFMNALMKMSPAIVASARKSIAEGGDRKSVVSGKSVSVRVALGG